MLLPTYREYLRKKSIISLMFRENMVCAGEEGKVIDIMDDLMIQQEHDKGARKKNLHY